MAEPFRHLKLSAQAESSEFRTLEDHMVDTGFHLPDMALPARNVFIDRFESFLVRKPGSQVF